MPPPTTSQGMDTAITAVPPGHRRRLTVTCDGAGASHGLSARRMNSAPGATIMHGSNRTGSSLSTPSVPHWPRWTRRAGRYCDPGRMMLPRSRTCRPRRRRTRRWSGRPGQGSTRVFRLRVPRAPYEVIGAARGEAPPRSVTGRDVRASTPGGQPAGVVLTGPTSPRHRSPCLVGCLLQGG